MTDRDDPTPLYRQLTRDHREHAPLGHVVFDPCALAERGES